MYDRSWRTTFRIARWALLVAVLVILLPVFLFFGVAVLILVPKGRIWGTFWGTVFANGATGLWHKIFGPPRVQIHHPRVRNGRFPMHRLDHWRN